MKETLDSGDFKSPSFGGVGEVVTATYYIETPFSVFAAAEVLAGEQSSGTLVAVLKEITGY